MTTIDRAFTIAILAFIAVFLALGAWHYDYAWTVMRFPVLTGLTTCVICVGHIILADIRSRNALRITAGPRADATAGLRRALPAMAWVAAVIPVLLILGYVAGLPLYIFAYLKTHGQGWMVSAALAAATLAVVYGGFIRLLGISRPALPIGF